jgi:hypothetical protein
MIVVQRKPYQQQTLSIRISEFLRDYLERAKEIINSEPGQSYSTSDVAKLLLDSLKLDQPNFRLDVAHLQAAPTESLVAIRTKSQQRQPLSLAELVFLSLYIRVACEELSEDPTKPDATSYVAVLEAVLAVRELRTQRGEGVDRWYREAIGAFDWGTKENTDDDPTSVPSLYARVIRQLRESPGSTKPVFAGRALDMAVRLEAIPDVLSLNHALDPFLPKLLRLAVRGHWIRHRRPARIPREGPIHVAFVPPATADGFQLTGSVTAEGELELALAMTERHATYLFGPYPQIREFAAMLRQLKPGQIWDGPHFRASADAVKSGHATWYHFSPHTNHVRFSFPEQEWHILQDLFSEVLDQAGLEPVLADLSFVYGEL